MMDLRKTLFLDYPNVFFVSLVTILSFFASGPRSSVTPIVLSLSALLLYSRIVFYSNHALRNVLLLWSGIIVGSALPWMMASLDALSTVGTSILVLLLYSATTSLLVLGVLYLDVKLNVRLRSSLSQITLFPALWATLWSVVAYFSPIGYLSTWSSMEGSDPYDWILQVLGPAGKQWVIAAWAVVISQVVGIWFIGTRDDEGPTLISDIVSSEPNENFSSARSEILSLAILLALLTVPSFFGPYLPLPTTVEDATPLGVGCVLPQVHKSKGEVRLPGFSEYLQETRKLQSLAKILLWPEGAVSFDSAKERKDKFEEIQKSLSIGIYVGVSFEETVDVSSHKEHKRIGLALLSNSTSSPHFMYFKRHLVPIAESFSLTHSTVPPEVYEIPLIAPKIGVKTPRPIPVTGSICLDFAFPTPFEGLDTRPALILAPARTWHPAIGYVMWRQATKRAEELNTMVLWCDGGRGGVSGIVGQGHNEVTQVGAGSWARTIGVQYPFNEQRSLYAHVGDLSLLLYWLLVFAPNRIARQYRDGMVHNIRSLLRKTRAKPPHIERGAAPNLLD